MHSFRLFILCPLLLAASLAGCDTTATQPDESQVFVESYQQAGTKLDTVWLTRTVDARSSFDAEENAVRSDDINTIKVLKLNEDGSMAVPTSYSEASPGVYTPDSDTKVDPGTSYRLEVDLKDGPTVTSTTTVPNAFTLENVENTTAVFQNPQRQPTFVLNPPDAASQQYEQDRQNVYFFTVTTEGKLDPDNLTPFYRDSYDADEDSIESFRVNSSGLLNQANFSSRGSGRVSVDLPWIGVAFFGKNTIGINLVDDNYYDFLRSESAQENAPPGEFPNIIEHVENGTGIFASYVRAEKTLTIQCNEQFLGGDSACP